MRGPRVTPPRIRRTIPPPSESSLPRFAIGADDSTEVQATAQRKSLRPYRAVSATWPSAGVSADSTADVALEDILLEAYVEPPPTKRSPQPKVEREEKREEPFRVTFPSVPPPRPSEQARVDALLARHVDIPVEVEVPSIAPVALATPGDVRVFPLAPPVFVPQAPPQRGNGAAIVAALAALLVAGATGAGVALVTHPAWIAKAKSVVSIASKDAPIAAAPPQLPPPSTVVTAPPAPAPPAPSSDPPSQPTIAPSTTLVTFPPYATGHRIFFDGKLVAYDGSPVALACGRHVLRIGMNGRVRNVSFACGEATTLK
ncbi:MAG TPA: hypothetical protein VIF62_20980 [Labilithrix sp.]|jgi:hypothetical protein